MRFSPNSPDSDDVSARRPSTPHDLLDACKQGSDRPPPSIDCSAHYFLSGLQAVSADSRGSTTPSCSSTSLRSSTRSSGRPSCEHWPSCSPGDGPRSCSARRRYLRSTMASARHHGPALAARRSRVAPVGLSRFVVRSTLEAMECRSCRGGSHYARRQSQGSVAVILNTVRDAVTVYRKIKAKTTGGRWYFLASRMLPGHKGIHYPMDTQATERGSLSRYKASVLARRFWRPGVDLSFRTRSCVQRPHLFLDRPGGEARPSSRRGDRLR